ncbi:MAG: ADP-ribosylation factor-like protein [Actinomycetota bacterium]|nr:ADP-ribosylation factor-like protein [Actinomycetota bacterium]MDQ6945823.1 ADP-ribosylation factor-like protein [Actinomycetota bacterium]
MALDLSNNSLSNLPDAFASLSKLQVLNLSYNRFTDIPAWLFHLPLKTIELQHNRLTLLPDAFSYTVTLENISVANNSLTSLPAGLFDLPRLSKADVSSNGLTELPPLQPGTHLSELDISDNSIGALPSLSSCTHLEWLDCSGNLLTTLPDALPDRLVYLDLADNDVAQLPDKTDFYRRLRYLNVSSNNLLTLPYTLTETSDFTDINVNSNPLSRTMLTAASNGTESLLAYMRSLGEATQPCREAKLVLIGEGNVGKSSVVAALAGEPFIENRATTHGIRLSSLTLHDKGRDVDVKLNIWDFGGQEIYRVTHQFYLSQDSVFLVVWRPREGFEQSGINFWLDRVRRLVGTRGSIYLVSTYAEEGRQSHIDLEDLQYRYYPLIKGWIEVDNRSGRGIEELKGRLASAAMALDHIDDPLAISWIALRDELMSGPEPFVTRDEYDLLAMRHGVGHAAGTAWLRLLHALGHLIYFERDIDLRTTIVVDPELLAQAVSYVLEDASIVGNGGIVEHEYLVSLWQRSLAGAGVHNSLFPYLLRLMERNEISFRLPDLSSSLIAPVITFSRPLNLPWEPGDPILTGEHELRARCYFGIEPIGLIPWLIVRSHRWASLRMWRRGLFLETRLREASALVELIEEKTLSITVRGAYPAELFSILRSEVEWLVSTRWPYVEVDIVIPCPKCRPAAGSRKVGQFRAGTLQRAAARSVRSLQCGECFESVAVVDLLSGFDVKTEDGPGDQFGQLESKIDRLYEEVMPLLERSDDAARTNIVASVQMSEYLRQVRRTIALVAADSPQLFSLVPEDVSKCVPSRLWRTSYRLQLWCEEPGSCHPVGKGYVFTKPREWFIRAAPLVRTTLRLLRFVPVVSTAASDLLSAEAWSDVNTELQTMASLSEALWDLEGDRVGEPSLAVERLTSGGFELRVIKELLAELDPDQILEGLSKVVAEGGDVLWICPTHYRLHDPGLPVLPTQTESSSC